jgi:hypothetical protein
MIRMTTFTVKGRSEILHQLASAMRKYNARTIHLSKKKDGQVIIRVSADRGKDVRDFARLGW